MREEVWFLEFQGARPGEGIDMHPYLVISRDGFNSSDTVIGLLITTKNTHGSQVARDRAIEIESGVLVSGLIVGFIHPGTIHTLNWIERKGSLKAKLKLDFVDDVVAKMVALLDPEQAD